MRLWARLLAVSLALTLGSAECKRARTAPASTEPAPTTAASTPHDAALAFQASVEAGRFDQAWSQLTAGARKETTQGAWTGFMKDTYAGLGAVKSRGDVNYLAVPGPTVPRRKNDQVVAFASKYKSGARLTQILRLEQEAGIWRVAATYVR
jgi:hypothetical protein